MQSDDARRAVRTRRVEAVALGLLAALPVVPWVAFVLRDGPPRGDLPGNLVPLARLFPGNPTRLFLAACVLHALSAATVTTAIRLFARRSHAIAALLVVLSWFAAFGNVAARPEGALLVVMPLMAFLASIAMFARGKILAAYPSVVWGAFAFHVHLVARPTVVMGSLVAVVSFAIVARQRGGLGWSEPGDRGRSPVATSRRRVSKEAVHLVVALGMLLAFVLPPVMEVGRPAIVRPFTHTAPRPAAVATREWIAELASMPDRVARRTLAVEPHPLALTSREPSATSHLVAMLHVAALGLATLLSAGRRDAPSLALLGLGALGDVLAVATLQVVPSELWTTAASSLCWIGVLAALFSALGRGLLRVPRLAGLLALPLLLVGFGAAIATTMLQRESVRLWSEVEATSPGPWYGGAR